MRRQMALLISFLIPVLVITSCSFGKTTPAPPTNATTPTLVPANTVLTSQSNELIDAALQAGQIDAQTALVYKIYAQFTDSRLPAIYQGGVNLATDSHILDEVQAEYPNLSPENQAIVLPFMMPPVYKGAWGPPAAAGTGKLTLLDLPCDEIAVDKWDSVSAMHSPVRFWWAKDRPGDAAIANRFMTAMDDDIWPKLTALMGRVPLPDGDSQCNGGGPEFDVYITPKITRSYSAAYFPPGCRETPSYIVLNPGVKDAILAHEFMHAIQWSYNTSADCMYPGEYAWLAEATASWSQNYVYPEDDSEHDYVPSFYEGGNWDNPPVFTLKNDSHEYGAYLFFFYLSNHFGQPGIIKQVWDNTTSMKSAEAVNKAIPGGFEAVFGDFAVENLIEPPHEDYLQWDNLNVRPSYSSFYDVKMESNQSYNFMVGIKHLSIRYDDFTFTEDSRLVTFFNGLAYQLDDEPINTYMGTIPINDGTLQYKFTPVSADDTKGLKIQAYFKIQGETDWQLEDWTNKPYVSFCRDAQAERLTDLIIITSNSSLDMDVEPQGIYNPKILTSDIGCWRYGGSASMQLIATGEGGTATDTQTLSNVAFERTEVHPDIPYPFLHFKVVEGQLNHTYDYLSSDGTCTANGQRSDPLTGASPYTFGNDLYILYGGISGSSMRRYGGEAISNLPLTVNAQCPDGSGLVPDQSLPWFYTDVLSQVLKKVYSVPNGGKLQGSDDMLQDTGNATMKYEWDFESLAETGESGTGQTDTSGAEGNSSGTGSGASNGTPQSPQDVGMTDVPNYTHVESSRFDEVSGMLTITTPDSLDDVVNYYTDQLSQLGWMNITNPDSSSPDISILTFAKDDKLLSIMISETDGSTQIMLREIGG